MMNVWTTRMGYPYLKVNSESFASTSCELTLKQQWFLADGSVTDADFAEVSKPIWHIPLLFATSGFVSDKATVMSDEEQTFSLPLSGESDFVKINAGQKALVRVSYRYFF